MCGIAGAFDVEKAFFVIHDLLHHLQHRGQEAAGVVSRSFRSVKGYGLVGDVLTEKNFIDGKTAIGHVRYSTVGGPEGIQPIISYTAKGRVAVAHNGTIPDAERRRNILLERGAVFASNIDSELFAHYISLAPFDDALGSVLWTLETIEAAYSLLVLHKDFLVAVRDPFGYRPLFWAEYGGGYVVASEDAALRAIGAKNIVEMERGEVIVFRDGQTPQIRKLNTHRPGRLCAFEYIYFARPDSTLGGVGVHRARFRMGQILYEEHPVSADIVVPVLDSGLSGALGFSAASGIPLDIGLMRNRYVGRTFIMPSQRESSVRKKIIPIEDVVKGKDVVIVDDSLIRGNTMKVLVSLVKEAGARKVIVAIHSPPVRFPCFYGIDIDDKEELIAADLSISEVRDYIGADELVYLSTEGLLRAIGSDDICLSCFTGKYDTPVPVVMDNA